MADVRNLVGGICRRRWALRAVLVGLVAVISLGGRAAAWRVLAPPEAVADPGPVRPAVGSLLVCGGGALPDEVRERFLELAGGPRSRIVVIPTAHRAADGPEADRIYVEPWRSRGAGSVVMLHTRDRKQSDDPAFIAPLREATGVWIAGGKQGLLADTYADTEVERQLHALLERGGVVAGTSAGAAVMTRVMIAGGRSEATIGQGFDLLPGVVVDQHFLKRNRLGRLLGVLARHPDCIGFGIDEETALLITGSQLRVLGRSYVVACLPGTSPAADDAGAVVPAAIPAALEEASTARIEILKPGDQADLSTFRTPDPRIASTIELD